MSLGSAITNLNPAANLGLLLITGYADLPFVVRIYTLTPKGTEQGADDVLDNGRVYTPLSLRTQASFDAEMRPSADSSQYVSLTASRTESEPYNELTVLLDQASSATIQGWQATEGVITIHGVGSDGARTPLGQGRWRVKVPSAARTGN